MTLPDRVPDYDSLGMDGRTPRGSSWGVFGADDELGTLNFLTPDVVLAASQTVREGIVIPLNWYNNLPEPSILGRNQLSHIRVDSDAGFADDWYDGYNPQKSSQWDALAHARHPAEGYYNGIPHAQVLGESATRLGIQNAAEHGIVGRFVLADVVAARLHAGTPLDASASEPVACGEIAAILAAEGVVPRQGDILLVHFGWTSWYEDQDPEVRASLGGGVQFSTPGLEPTEESARWLWNNGFAAVAADVPALEVMPISFDSVEGILHYRLIPLLGFSVGEMLDLSRLARECARLNRYEGLFVAAPVRQPGGIGSPANAVAIV